MIARAKRANAELATRQAEAKQSSISEEIMRI